jgi:hypothetical protein
VTEASTCAPAVADARNRYRTTVPLAALAALALVVALVSNVTSATWADSTRNDDNAWATATVSLTDDHEGVAMFTTTKMVPGTVVEKAITVTNDGEVALAVRLYSESLSNSDIDDPLAAQLNLKIGTSAGAGDLFDGTVAGFAATHGDYAGGIADTVLDPAASEIYHFWVELGSGTGDSFSGANAVIDFVWEGQTQ